MSSNNSELLSQLKLSSDHRDDSGNSKKPIILSLLFLIVLGAGALAYYLLGNKAIVVETTVAVAAKQTVSSTPVLDAAGYVTARRIATVSSKTTGKLQEVLIEEGDIVEENQVLARLEDTEQQAQLNLNTARLNASLAQMEQIRVRLDQAERNLARQNELIIKNLTSRQQLDDAQTAVDTLKAEMASQKRDIEVAQASIAISNVDLDNTIVRAPFAGVVIAKAAQPGEIVSPGAAGGGNTRTGIGTIVDMDSLEIEVDVNEAFINRVTSGQKVIAVLDAYPNWKIPAAVIAIIPAADRAKATVRVRIALLEKDSRVVPDMGVRVSFFEDENPDVAAPEVKGVMIPARSIVQSNNQSAVFVVDGETARLKTITPGQTYGEMRLVEQGLTAGERIVREPPADLIDGAKITTAE